MSSRLNNPKYLVSAWPCNSHVQDVVRANNGTWTGTPTYQTGPFNGHSVGYFNGASFVGCGADTSLDYRNEGSFSAWFNVDNVAATIKDIIRRKHASGLWMRVEIGGQFSTNVPGVNSRYSVVTIVPGVLYHVVVCFDATSLDVYFNGALTDSVASGGIMTSLAGETFCIGASGPVASEYFAGSIFNVRDYRCKFTGDEVKELFDLERRQ